MTHLYIVILEPIVFTMPEIRRGERTLVSGSKNVLGMPNFPYTFSLARGLRWITSRKNALNRSIRSNIQYIVDSY